jgi:hypothetical protein
MDRLRILSLYLILWILVVFGVVVSSQDETPTIIPLPTPSTDVWPFPIGMFCNEIEPGLGSSWRGITIGESTLDEFEQALFELSEEYAIVERPNPANRGILYSVPSDIAEENQLPRSVIVCSMDDIVYSLRVSNPAFPEPSFFLDDWIAKLGEPDVVTWSTDMTTRVVFWFQEGIALDVFVGEPEYGAIFSTVYFPYQDSEGYADRFPYNRTAITPFIGDVLYDPPIPTAQNPFDFDAIIATMTAEPSRTATPTFTPAAGDES